MAQPQHLPIKWKGISPSGTPAIRMQFTPCTSVRSLQPVKAKVKVKEWATETLATCRVCNQDVWSWYTHIIPWNDVFSSHKRGHCIADHQGSVVQSCEVIYKTHVFKAAHQGIEAAKMLVITRPEADLTAKIPVFLKKLFFSEVFAINNFWFICSQKQCWYLLSGYHIPF